MKTRTCGPDSIQRALTRRAKQAHNAIIEGLARVRPRCAGWGEKSLNDPLNGELIHINVSQVTSVRFDTQIPGANAELGFASGKVQGVRENVDDVMQMIAAIAGEQGKP